MAQPFLSLLNPASLPDALARPVLAIGNFDGMHLGHAALVREAVRLGGIHDAPAAILTFEPHPRLFFRPDQPLFRLTQADMKADAAQTLGAEGVITLTFDAGLAAMSAEDFVTRLILGAFSASGVVVGPDFHFGRGRRGTPALLTEMGRAAGIAVSVMPPQMLGDTVVSSSHIRALLQEGDVAAATRFLGREWQVRAVVAHGDKRGRLLGYPTANLHLPKDVALKHGIYAVRAAVDGRQQPAVASFGCRPTFDGGEPKLEVHVFDFAGDLYGRTMDVAFVGFIRPELRFDGVEPLIRQMDQDSLMARKMLESA
jgi:riboflavin kinase / FMN adenylyltransferase